MRDGDPGPGAPRRPGPDPAPAVADRQGARNGRGADLGAEDRVLETEVSPFHCLYQDALHFHSQSQLRLARSENEASRLARGAAALRGERRGAGASGGGRAGPARAGRAGRRPEPPAAAGRRLAAPARDRGRGPRRAVRPRGAPLAAVRRAAGAADVVGLPRPRVEAAGLLPLDRPRRLLRTARAAPDPPRPGRDPRALHFPRTGLPRDPYALRPRHLDTARGVLDAAIEALDRRLGGALVRDGRHRKEPVRVVFPKSDPTRGR